MTMTILLFATLIWQVVDFLRELANVRSHRSSVVTQVTAWLGGIALVWIGSAARATSELVLPGTDLALGQLDGGSIVLYGLLAASLASSIVDTKQAIDNTDTSRQPRLLGRASGG